MRRFVRRRIFEAPNNVGLARDGGRLIVEGPGGERFVEEAIGMPEDEGPGNTEEIAGRDFIRDIEVGSVNRSAAGFDEGVDGLVGGICTSIECIRLVELVCTRAFEDAVAAEYPCACLEEPDEDGGTI